VGKEQEQRRVVLPISQRVRPETAMMDARDTDQVFPKIEPVKPPTDAPNVLVVLLDDVGYGATSAFGGVVNTPTADRLAQTGLRYTRFHTTALCAPTRQALLTGRNHHTVNMGAITELATGARGNTSAGRLPRSSAQCRRVTSRSQLRPPERQQPAADRASRLDR